MPRPRIYLEDRKDVIVRMPKEDWQALKREADAQKLTFNEYAVRLFREQVISLKERRAAQAKANAS